MTFSVSRRGHRRCRYDVPETKSHAVDNLEKLVITCS